MSLLRFLARAPYAICITASMPFIAMFAWGLNDADDPWCVWGDLVLPMLRDVWFGEGTR